MRLSLLIAAIVFIFPSFLIAQNPSPAPAAPPSSGYPRRTRLNPCWEQAGIAPDVARQGREIELNTHEQVTSVCNDPSLSMEQKGEQVRQLRAQGFEKLRGLVSQQQADAYKACVEQRRGPGAFANRGGAPCREITANPGANPPPRPTEQ